MLVRFLSFVASVLGTARYKAIIFSCLALIFSFTGIAVMASWHDKADSNAASQVEQSQAKNKDERQQGSPQLGQEQKQAIQNEEPQQSTKEGGRPDTSEQPSGNSSTTGNEQQIDADILIVNTTALTLAAGATSSSITATIATTANISNPTLEVIDNSESIFIEQQQSINGGIQFVVRATADIKKDQPYEIVVVVKDASQKIIDSQPITVTIQQ